ncbi:MAG: hypothetical protein NTV49_10945 [Kiritimatiellaeota bacterium]|nr:hypothetical protein [Kiritimatiellota bacterium]
MIHIRTRLFALGLALALPAAAGAAAAEPPAKAPAAKADAGEDVTVITSDKLTFDYKQKYALFEEHVVVTDPQLQLTSDKLTAIFGTNDTVQSLKAEGHVTIRQADKRATANVATYDVASGKVVLAGQPRAWQGQNMLEGEVITFWRNESRMLVYPQARLLIYPEKGGTRDRLPFGK